MDNVRQQQIIYIKQQLIAVKFGAMGVQTDNAKPIVTTRDAETEARVINVNRDTQAGVDTRDAQTEAGVTKLSRDAQTSKNIVAQTRQASDTVNPYENNSYGCK